MNLPISFRPSFPRRRASRASAPADMTKRLLCLALAASLTACAVGPKYEAAPAMDVPVAFKEGQGAWVPAAPADAVDRGAWWALFRDPVLDGLAAQVDVSNQNVAAAVAAYAQARAVVGQQRAGLFPTVDLSGSGSRSGSRAGTTTTSTGTVVSTGGGPRNNFQFDIGASWEPDVWGRLSRGVTGAQAGAAASQADLASARLAAQGELAVNYFNLRSLDVQRDLLARTVEGYQRTATITNNRYTAGIVARTDVLQAQTQLANARADLLGAEQQRAQLEHAIAVLVGKAPAG
jgi:NodT family efflux transporter outer membrane factor (OMF) lipoprotein